ncbi:MAG: chemotaxis protein CheW [Candidatus Heimdallarchaeota archaeon]|nr:MAG: chemotaxis protein CheW [Candidatus Heimdallarchaeota archaeon]
MSSIEGKYHKGVKIILKTKKIKKTSRNQQEDNLLLFTLLDNNYALFSSSVIQILQTLPITPVANSVPYFVGSTTFRGEIVPVIDLQSFFYGGLLNLSTRRSENQNNYIALEHTGKIVIFQVETVLGSIKKPEESEVTNLVNFANPEENSYFVKAFLSNIDQIIVLLDDNQILERVVYDLENTQTQFVIENQALLVPIELLGVPEEYNIDLRQKLSVPVPSATDRGFQRALKDTKKTTNTATLVSVQELDILIPNNRIIEIFNVQSVTKVPNAPKAVVGTINFRGKVISVLDLTEILVPSSSERKKIVRKQDDVQAIILESIDQQVAIIVDEFHEIVEMIETDLHPAVGPTKEKDLTYYFQGVMLDRSGNIILVLNVNYFFQAISDLSVINYEKPVIFFTIYNAEDILKSRAIKQSSLDENALVLITLLDIIYAIKCSCVIEILQTLTITPIANSAPYFVGSTTFRGEIVPVIDLHSFFYGELLSSTTKQIQKPKNYIVGENKGKFIIFQVESVLGSISKPEESELTSLVNSTNTNEVSFFPGAFLYNDQIVVQLDHQEILNRIVYELEQMQTQFTVENQTLLVPFKSLDTSEELNINLKQNIPVQRSIIELKPKQVVSSSHNLKHKGTLVSVGNLNILVPNIYISEIFNITSTTKVPNAPKAIIGSTNYRGSVISVLNLAEVLKSNSTPTPLTSNEVLILEVKDQHIALFTDKILSIIEIDENSLRPILSSAEGDFPLHIIQGLMLTPSEQIILILNAEYLFHIANNPILLEQESDQILYFKNPVQESIHQSYDIIQEGYLFEDKGHIFLLNSQNVIQVIEENSFLFKEFPHDAIKGATIHTNIVPLIDFNTILREKNGNNAKKSVGILINDPKSNTEAVLLVDNILDKITIENCEIYQNSLGLSRNTLSPIISGFFSYNGALGMIMNPDSLYMKIRAVLQNTLSLKDTKEFSSTLLPKEVKFLEEVKSKRKDLELLLFYRHEGIRLDYFVFKLQHYTLSIDVTFVRRVLSSLNWKKIDTTFFPIIGIAEENNSTLPVIDLSALVFNSQNQTEYQDNSFLFLLEFENLSFLVPADDIEGVITKFKEELIPCEDSNIFLEGKKTCKHVFSYEKILSTIHVIENEFLEEIISKKNIKTLLKRMKKEQRKEKD